MSSIAIASLNVYPVKSCAPTALETATLTEFGIEHDRERMVVGENGQPFTQRNHPALALVRPSLGEGVLTLQAPGMEQLELPLARDPDAEVVPVNLWNKPGTGTDQGAEASGWFSDYLGKTARLLAVSQSRLIKPECRVAGASERTAFADGFPFLLTSVSSLEDFNTHLPQPIPMDRFRPNIVVSGAPAYAEDRWRTVRLGGLHAFVVRACARCSIPNIAQTPNIDQEAGVLPQERPVSAELRRSRQGIDPISDTKEVFFGQNLTHVFEPGLAIHVGDPVEVIVQAAGRNWRPL